MMPLENKRLFYVEDDLNNRTVVRLALQNSGATIHFERFGHISNTLAALRALGPWDLIMLDLMFPNSVTGYDIYRSIRSVEDLENVPVIAISASDPAIEVPRTRMMGFSGFIGKPIDIRSLPTQIEQILEKNEYRAFS